MNKIKLPRKVWLNKLMTFSRTLYVYTCPKGAPYLIYKVIEHSSQLLPEKIIIINNNNLSTNK